MRSFPRKYLLSAALAVGLAGTATTAVAAGVLGADGQNLESQWTSGGHVSLELDDRNVRPVICFAYDNPAPQDGDSIASRILTRAGAEVVDLGTADQWIDGAGEGCELPADDRYRDVFAHPGDYVVELRVVENQGTAVTSPLRSLPLQTVSG
jgi:hypothetical protein